MRCLLSNNALDVGKNAYDDRFLPGGCAALIAAETSPAGTAVDVIVYTAGLRPRTSTALSGIMQQEARLCRSVKTPGDTLTPAACRLRQDVGSVYLGCGCCLCIQHAL